MSVPSQMYLHTLNPLKGWPSPTALDFAFSLASTVLTGLNGLPLPAGRCVHVDSVTAISYGYGPGPTNAGGVPLVKTGATGTQMGIFVFQGSQDYDVSNPAGPPPGYPNAGTDWYAIMPNGIQSGLVATGAYELETTEFDQSQTYLPNQPLRAVANDTTAATPQTGGGCLTNQGVTVGTNAYVGVVSRGVYTNAYNQTALAFWPVYAPTASA